MKKKMVLCLVTWVLFTGLAWPNLLPKSLPSAPFSAPLPLPALESKPMELKRPSSFLLQLEESWRTERLLAVSA